MHAYSCEIIDSHIHPAVTAATSIRWFGSSGDFGKQVDDLRRAGISRACGAPVARMAPARFDEVRALNDLALSLRDRFPAFYLPGIQVHPRFPDESCREVERCCGREGARWVGELVGYMMGYAEEYDTPAALAVMTAIRDHQAVVNLHCYNLDVIDRLCTALPDLKVVLAHPGRGKEEIESRVARLKKHANLHLDIAGSGIDRLGVLRHAMDTAGCDRLLFGTDFPINNPAVYVHAALFEDLSDAERTALCRDNFLRLHGATAGNKP